MKDGKITIARIFKAYHGPSDYYLHQQMRMLDPKRFETICVYLGKRTEDRNPLEEEGFKCFYLTSEYRTQGINLKLIFRLCKLFREQRVDIAHCMRHQPALYAALASLFVRVPVILYHVHGKNRAERVSRKFFYLFFGKRFSKILAISQAVADDVVSNYPSITKSRVLVLANSIQYERFANAVADRTGLRRRLNIPPEAFVFIAIGRLAPTKGYPYLLDAFAEVKRRCPNAHLLIVGEGDFRPEIEQTLSASNAGRHVTLLGQRNDVPELLKICDAFVLSSIAEGFGLVVLEAMAAGLPVVVTDSGGPSEIVQHGCTGFVAPPSNAGELARWMLHTLSLPDAERETLIGRAVSEVFHKYRHELIVSRLEKIYETEFNAKQKKRK